MATTKVYSQLLEGAFDKEIDILADTIKVALVTSSYTPDQDAHNYWDDVVANEITGTGYTEDGITLSTKVFSYTSGTNTWKFDADDVSWTSSTLTARYAVIYNNTPAADSDKSLIAYVDFGSNQSSSSGTFSIQWNANGIFTITVD